MRPERITETYHTGIPDSLAKPRQAGLTLLELCVVTGILAFTVAWTAPRLDGFMARNEVTSDVMRLKEVLATARNAAIVRRTVITVCPSRDGRRCSDDWTMPLSILQGESTCHRANALSSAGEMPARCRPSPTGSIIAPSATSLPGTPRDTTAPFASVADAAKGPRSSSATSEESGWSIPPPTC